MKKVAVIFGGSSTERDVSLHTGLAVVESIKDKYDVKSIDISDDYSNLNEKLIDIDLVFIALHGGFGENGTIQKYFEKHNIKFTGSDSKSSSIAMDKNKTKIIAKKNNIPVLDWFLANEKSKIDTGKLNFPLIIKPNDGGSTIGLYFCKNSDDFNFNIKKAFKFSKTVMIEQYIRAREVSVPILDGQVLPIIEIFPNGFLYDYDSKYKEKGSSYQVPAKINDNTARKLAEDSIKLYKKIGCKHYVRIDYLLNENNHYLLEINTLPGLTSTSLLPKSALQIGLDYSTLVDKIIDIALKK
tara:strand:+ start:1217 stop:2110 length:894 start_codon:yes stop_codon:yes gene_type:complete